MRKSLLKFLDVNTDHHFGVVDTFQDGWNSELSMEAESYGGHAFLRLRLYQTKLGGPGEQGRVSRFIYRKLLGLEIVRVLDEVPNRVHDPYATQRLECHRRTDGREFCQLQQRRRKNKHVTGSIMTFPRSSLTKLISALDTYR